MMRNCFDQVGKVNWTLGISDVRTFLPVLMPRAYVPVKPSTPLRAKLEALNGAVAARLHRRLVAWSSRKAGSLPEGYP